MKFYMHYQYISYQIAIKNLYDSFTYGCFGQTERHHINIRSGNAILHFQQQFRYFLSGQ